jgi:hypothetical protein
MLQEAFICTTVNVVVAETENPVLSVVAIDSSLVQLCDISTVLY